MTHVLNALPAYKPKTHSFLGVKVIHVTPDDQTPRVILEEVIKEFSGITNRAHLSSSINSGINDVLTGKTCLENFVGPS